MMKDKEIMKDKNRRHNNKDWHQREDVAVVTAPINEQLSPQKRLEGSLELSDLVTRMVTHVICHAIVDYQELLKDERLSVASAFLQRVTSTHLCNHKLTKEGIVYRYNGESFRLHEEFKTMTLTRSVYEHLVMFYFLFEHPKSDGERRVVWNYWKANSKKNLLDYDADASPAVKALQDSACREIEELRKEIFSIDMDDQCRQKLDEWTRIGKPTQNGCIAFYHRHGATDVRRVSYNQAWKYLFEKADLAPLYRHLSMHSHPIYDGLLQYQDQTLTDAGYDGIPLYLSSCFLAYLCRLFLKLIPDGQELLRQGFSHREILIFNSLSQLPSSQRGEA